MLSKTTAPHDDDSLSCLLITIKILECSTVMLNYFCSLAVKESFVAQLEIFRVDSLYILE